MDANERRAAEAERRRKAHRAGHGAESIAVLYLRLTGWRILARRYLVQGGEIDIVARRGRTIAFVEVKRRASLDVAATSIDGAKRRRMSRAARAFVSRQRAVADFTYRADALFIAPWRLPRHVPAIFELDLD